MDRGAVMFLGRLFAHLCNRMNSFAEKMAYRKLNLSPIKDRDCFETVRVLTQIVKPKYLCDIGGYIGKWSYAMHKMNPELEHVVFFEPQKKFYEELEALDLGNVEKVTEVANQILSQWPDDERVKALYESFLNVKESSD